MNRASLRDAAVETSSDGVVVVGDDGTVLDCNPAAGRALGVEPEDAVGEPLPRVAPDLAATVDGGEEGPDPGPRGDPASDGSRAVDDDADPRAEGAVVGSIVESGDGGDRQYEVRVSRFDADGRSGRILSLRDVTDRRRHRRRLGVLNRVLRHDLRNGMNVILGYAEMLEERRDAGDGRPGPSAPLGDTVVTDPTETPDGFEGNRPPKPSGSGEPGAPAPRGGPAAGRAGAPDPVERIREAATELLDLAEQIREVEATVDATDAARTALDAVGLLSALTESLEREYPHADVTFEAPDTAWISAVDIVDSAFDNLLENAVVHSHREHPSVEVTVRREGERVAVTVADDGPGIPEQELATFRADGETQLTHSSGFGLWLVVWLVEESGGSVDFDVDETGTAVTVRLPAADPPE
ncbi:sensor histidine kinase [Halobaculum sp. EA56]|uniref:sensor histidine kinase n=1 Tax=Halobaculum sp. EA56 TaxID=3421648 RepID=UPI003EBAE6AA